ncbi:hypothetical protein DFH29DRAFT_128764 [Suillus ampliporus]|nr:hypothetical protein DFH29DRAFT_128764 [Suillus ampliporus]
MTQMIRQRLVSPLKQLAKIVKVGINGYIVGGEQRQLLMNTSPPVFVQVRSHRPYRHAQSDPVPRYRSRRHQRLLHRPGLHSQFHLREQKEKPLPYNDKHRSTFHAENDMPDINNKPMRVFNQQKQVELEWNETEPEHIVESTVRVACTYHRVPTIFRKGVAFQVVNVSAIDLVVRLTKPASYDDIKKAIKDAAHGLLKGIVAYTDDAVVSTNFLGYPASAIVDAGDGIMINDEFVKLVAFMTMSGDTQSACVICLNMLEGCGKVSAALDSISRKT